MANTFYGGIGASEPRATSQLDKERFTDDDSGMPDMGTMELFGVRNDKVGCKGRKVV